MANSLDQSNQLALIRCYLHVPRCELTTEISNRTLSLMKDNAKTCHRRITVDCEQLTEIRQMEDRGCSECHLEGVEGCCCGVRPMESVLLQELGEGGCNGTEIVDEAPVIAG